MREEPGIVTITRREQAPIGREQWFEFVFAEKTEKLEPLGHLFQAVNEQAHRGNDDIVDNTRNRLENREQRFAKRLNQVRGEQIFDHVGNSGRAQTGGPDKIRSAKPCVKSPDANMS